MKSFDAVIIGGGIVGTACAYRLSQAGLSVALIEKRFISAGVTSAGMGHILVMDDSEAQVALTSRSREIWRELSGDLPDICEFENCGTLWVASNEDELEEAVKKESFYRKKGIHAKVVDSEELRRLEPALSEELAGGLRVEDDCVVYQPAAARFFASEAKRMGAVLIENDCGEKLVDSSLTLSSKRVISAPVFVNAAGLGASKFSPELRISPKKGHLVITDRYEGLIGHQIAELGYAASAHSATGESVAFNVQPRITGQVLIGSSRQPGVSSTDTDRRIVGKMINRAVQYMPALSDLKATRIWTGVRPATRDNIPYIGRSTTNKHVVVAAGHEGLGITTATGTAEIVTDMILGRPSKIPVEPYSVERDTGT